MRICQVMLGRGFGGAERAFVDASLSLADRGHDVLAVCHPKFARRDLLEAHPGVRTEPVLVRAAWDLGGMSRLRRAIHGFGPDVVHAHLARSASLAGRALRGAPFPVVAKLHNYAKLKYYRHVHGLIGTTDDQLAWLLRAGVPADRCTAIPNFSRVPAAPAPRTPRGLEVGAPLHVVSCGRLHDVKGFDVLLQALAMLRAHRLPVRATIAGDGPERVRLLALRKSLALESIVEFPGWIDEPTRLLDSGDLYVLSSRSESFGIALLEAMARGLPIVATRCRGPQQLIAEDQCWFADPGDASSLAKALHSALDSPALRSARAAQLHRLFRSTFTEAAVIPRILDFYRHCGAIETPPVPAADRVSTALMFSAGETRADAKAERLWAHADWTTTLNAIGWTNVKDVMRSDRVEHIRSTRGRENARVRLKTAETSRPAHAARASHDAGDVGAPGARQPPGPSGLDAAPRLGFLKRHRVGAAWWRPWERLTPGLDEANAVRVCQQAGVPTMRIIAAGARFEDGGAAGPVAESFVLSEALPAESLFDVIAAQHRTGRFGSNEARLLRRQGLAAAARTIRRLHLAGLRHHDLFLQHVFCGPGPDGALHAHLIDVQRLVQPSVWTRGYFWLKDMEQMRFSMDRLRLPAEEVRAWYANYFRSAAQTAPGLPASSAETAEAEPAELAPLSLDQRLLILAIRLRGLPRSMRLALRRRRSAGAELGAATSSTSAASPVEPANDAVSAVSAVSTVSAAAMTVSAGQRPDLDGAGQRRAA